MFRVLFFVLLMYSCAADAANECANLLHLRGEFIQGELLFGQIRPGDRVTFNDQPVTTLADGTFLIGLDRDATSPAEFRLFEREQPLCSFFKPVRRREYSIQRINGLPDRQVHPDAAALQRIEREAAAIQTARSKIEQRDDFKQHFIWPAKGPITGVYGSQRILNGEPRRPHYGVDVAAAVGTPVIAPAAGEITYCNDDMYFSGGTIVLDHGLGLSSSFLHLSEVLVEVGEKVKQGQIIGKVGATGRVTGAHLDWRMNWRKAYIDPQRLVAPMQNH